MDPVEAVQGIGDLLCQSIGAGIRLHIAPAASGGQIWPILADRAQLEVAVLNLVINARDAIAASGPGGAASASGDITITFANHAIGADQAQAMHPDPIVPGDYVGVTISDTGTGMPAEVLSRALEPFFTTKPAGAGTGLGLSQTYGFAIQSGGTLRMRSTVGAGTQMEILLPRAASSAAPVIEPPLRQAPSARGEVIVVAEDDALLRHTVGEALRMQGYVVETAANGHAALGLLRTLPRVDLLLTDIMMPGGMNGIELARAARGLSAGLRIMFASGFSDKDMLAQWPETLDVVNKPFSLDELCGRVGARLREGGTVTAAADA